MQCPYTYAMYYTADRDMIVGIYGTTLICHGTASVQDMVEYITTIAEVVGLDGQDTYLGLELGPDTRVVTMGGEMLEEEQIRALLTQQRDQARQCDYCGMSRSMDEYHHQAPREPEIVEVGPNQTMAYGSVQDLMTYEQAEEHIRWYLEHTLGKGCAMLADVSSSAYEIVLHHVEIDGVHYAGDSDYVTAADAQRLVDAGLAEYMQFE